MSLIRCQNTAVVYNTMRQDIILLERFDRDSRLPSFAPSSTDYSSHIRMNERMALGKTTGLYEL